MSKVSVNLRYFLWNRNPDRRTWPDLLAAWGECDVRRAEELLRGDAPRQDEMARIAKHAGVSVQELTGKDLLKELGVDVLLGNVRHLVDGLERGRKKTFAKDVGVHPTTVSAWLSGKQRPERTNLLVVLRYFRLPAGTDLEKDPFFLLPWPVAEVQRKRWLKEKIEGLDASALQDLFPALAKLLGTR